ncbi:MAG: WbuC family cupin fold metalloprotein [Bryobacterales bacterium]|nr:WbuC family cupin fold metalloprotein [Bryobacterales bacterium]
MAEQLRFQVISQDQIDKLVARANELPRRRINWNLHTGPDDAVHRFINVLLRGTYVAPHRHVTPPKPESFVVLEGELALFQFGESGEVDCVTLLGPSRTPRIYGIDLAPGVWHTLVVLSPVAAIFEVKPGPYVPTSDKDFAPWAPREGDPGAPAYRAQLEARAEAARSEDTRPVG